MPQLLALKFGVTDIKPFRASLRFPGDNDVLSVFLFAVLLDHPISRRLCYAANDPREEPADFALVNMSHTQGQYMRIYYEVSGPKGRGLSHVGVSMMMFLILGRLTTRHTHA